MIAPVGVFTGVLPVFFVNFMDLPLLCTTLYISVVK